jgi:Damage-control phosphatase ARMT1-like domain
MRPPPLRTDASNTFAHYSMKVRVPRILDEVIEQNSDFAAGVRDAVQRLRDDIRDDRALPSLRLPAPDHAEWEDALAERSGATWLGTDWFFAECYVYRSLMAAVRYWETGRDPFGPVKRAELAGERPWKGLDAVLTGLATPPEERLHELLALSLWGNRVDLSYAVGVAFGAQGEKDDLLSDDRAWAVPKLLVPGGDVHVVVDNTGSELSLDLVLADALIALAGARVTLHVKMHPTFVSDAIGDDVWAMVAAMEERGGRASELASRVRRAFDDGRLRVVPDFFWDGPRFLWDRPSRLATELDRATMVVLKGDANYRRAIGDALWPPEQSFGQVTSYFPAPLLCVRTLKSDPVVGLPAGLAVRLDVVDREWRINGRRGVIQGSGDR